MMGRLDRPAFEELIEARLSETELALLLSLPAIRPEVRSLLIQTQLDACAGEVKLTFYDLGELAGCVALQSKHTEDKELGRRLHRLFRHLVAVMQAASRGELGGSATAPELPCHMPLNGRVPVLCPAQ